MALDVSKLKMVKRRGDKIIAQCPVCFEAGGDKRGNHLVVYENGAGKFGCIAFPGDHEHRRQIFELVGLCDEAVPVSTLPAASMPEAVKPVDWRANCERLLRLKDVQERLARWRGWSVAFAEAVARAGVLGLHEGRVAFPVVDDSGAVIGRHCFQWPDVVGGPKAWYSSRRPGRC